MEWDSDHYRNYVLGKKIKDYVYFHIYRFQYRNLDIVSSIENIVPTIGDNITVLDVFFVWFG